MNSAFIISAIISTVIVLWWMIKNEKGGLTFIKSAFQGLAGMFAVNLLGMVTGVTIAVNWYSIISFIILGLPGVIGALMLNLIFRI